MLPRTAWPLRTLAVTAALAATGCTAVDVTRVPSYQRRGDVFITAESIREPYDSVGLVQVTRKGVHLFGFADPAGTDLQAAIEQVVPEVHRNGADGLMNVRVEMTQYTLLSRIFGAILFFAPQPAEVTITGEMVRLKSGSSAPTAPTTTLPGGQL